MIKKVNRIPVICISIYLITTFTAMAQSTLELTVDNAVTIALEKNRSLVIAERKVEEEKAGIGEARSSLLPQLSGTGTYTRLDVAPYISFGKKSPFPLPAGTPSKFVIGDENLYDLGVSIQQPLFTGFALKNNYEISKDSWEVAKNEHEKVEMDVILQTKEAYYNLLKTRKLVEISNEALKLMEAHVADLQNMLKVGIIAENDLLKSKVQLSETKLMKIRAENGAQLMQRRFCTVLNIPLTTTIVLKTPLEYDEKQYNLDIIIKEALENRPEIYSMTNQIKMAQNGVSIAKSQHLPQLMAVYNWNYKRPNREYEKEFYSMWTASVVAQLNFFDWGGISSRVTQAKLQQRQVEEGIKQLADAITLEANQAFLSLEEAKQSIEVTEINVSQAEENYRVTQKKFSQGLVNNTELLDANTALTRARIERTTAISDYLTALAFLERVTAKINR